MAANVRALQERDPGHPSLPRYHELARLLTGSPGASTADGIGWVRETVKALQIPSLSHYGITAQDVPILVERAAQASSMKGNPVVLTAGELAETLTQALF